MIQRERMIETQMLENEERTVNSLAFNRANLQQGGGVLVVSIRSYCSLIIYFNIIIYLSAIVIFFSFMNSKRCHI